MKVFWAKDLTAYADESPYKLACVKCGHNNTDWCSNEADGGSARISHPADQYYCDQCFPEHLKVLYALQRLA